MNYPIISEYVEAIKVAEDNFEVLTDLRPVLDADGEPIMTSGNFAVVFKMKDVQTGKLHAVKCFLKEQEGRAEAYRQIAEELEYVNSTFLTPIKYLDKELFVDTSNSDDSEFPVLLMDWVEGKTLDVYIKENINNQYALDILAYQFGKLAAWLLTQPFAHGDLKPDNILITEDGLLVLVDYDGMYVPAMYGCKAREIGSPCFRHPHRTGDIFDEHIDDFSIAYISMSLKAIALNPSLLTDYGGNDRLLFSETDFQNICKSTCLSALQALMYNDDFCTLYGIFMITLAKNKLPSELYRLFNIKKSKKENLKEAVMLYLKGRNFVEEKNYEEAYQIFYSLSKKVYAKGEIVDGVGYICGHVLGENGLAYLYSYGLHVARNYEKAVNLLRKAASNGFSLAQFNLGICYENGWGVKKNRYEAEFFYKKAADQNLGLAKSYFTFQINDLRSYSPSFKDRYIFNDIRKKELVSQLYL